MSERGLLIVVSINAFIALTGIIVSLLLTHSHAHIERKFSTNKLERASKKINEAMKLLDSESLRLEELLKYEDYAYSLRTQQLPPVPANSVNELTNNNSQNIVIQPTLLEQEVFSDLEKRFGNPSFIKSLNLAELKRMEEMQLIPEALRMVIISRAINMFNRGEVDEETFLSGSPGYMHKYLQ